ncbi:MAG: hypothetical protein H6512_07720 [Acidimicrobiia bacterium]|nr:hypothetical protein [Acidimicrobiia bacterium]
MLGTSTSPLRPPPSRGGYEELLPESEPLVLVDGTTTQVARLDAIVRSKEAADREKDRRALPYLRALLDQV